MFYEGEFDNPEFLSISGNWYWYENSYSNVNNDPFSLEDNITFVGRVGTQGYSMLCKDTILKLREKGYKVNYLPEGGVDFDDKFFESLNYNIFDPNQTTHYVITLPPHLVRQAIQKIIPNKQPNQKILVFCVWDSEFVKAEYIKELDDLSDGLILCSEWNKKTFLKCGYKKSIYLLKYEPNLIDLPDKNLSIEFINKHSIIFGEEKDLSKSLNYYTIGQWTNRKGITDTIKTFCSIFRDNHNVALIIKTFYLQHTQSDLIFCVNKMLKTLAKSGNHPTIYFLPGNVSTLNMFKIHSVGDIYVNLSKSESIGLSSLIAAYYNKPVIINKFGGQQEYLKDFKNISFIDYDLMQAADDLDFGVDFTNQIWGRPKLSQARDFMNNLYISKK